MSDVTSSPAAGRGSDSEPDHGQQRMAHLGAPASNIVAAPQATARVQVCQGKSCTKRGAVDLLQQASAAAAGQPGIEVRSLSPILALMSRCGLACSYFICCRSNRLRGSGHCMDVVVTSSTFVCRCLAASAWANANRGPLCAYALAGLDQHS